MEKKDNKPWNRDITIKFSLVYPENVFDSDYLISDEEAKQQLVEFLKTHVAPAKFLHNIEIEMVDPTVGDKKPTTKKSKGKVKDNE
ncbi:hypothetical protein [Pasteurella phage vB_PmuP_PS07]|nr:hypothetical protein [Pasteurella phage vB_PmuP_PS07]UIS74037.1 hypothetical protein [Pasteurella phage vB_PmuP_PS30]